MQNRMPNYYHFCDHFNLVPVWYITVNVYIFWCKDCDTFILRDFNNLGEYYGL